MLSRHAKSACCGAAVARFGGRRRRCAACRRTWRVRLKRRGRPVKRIAKEWLERVFLDRYPVRLLPSTSDNSSLQNRWHHFRKTARRFVAQKRRLDLPSGSLVLMIDGIWFRFNNKPWVLYQSTLKPCDESRAVFLDPILMAGKESGGRWRAVIDSIPEEVGSRIVAIVVDDLAGMKRIAKQRGWALQLCKIHLIRRIQTLNAGVRRARKADESRIKMYALTQRILEQPGGPQLECDIDELRLLSGSTELPDRVRALYREFLGCISYYRTHLMRPLMGIPSTTNAIESMGSIIRDMLRRSRAGSTPKSLQLWATALTRAKHQITCNDQKINRIN